MNSKLKFFIIFCFIFCFITNTYSFADNFDDEEPLSYLDTEIATSTQPTDIPIINARHAVIFDRNSKTILYGKDENEKCKMASTTKILTAVVVLENSSDLSSIVSVSSKAAHTGGSRLGLSTDDKISIIDLLYGLLMVSGNDAAVALAETVAGDIQNFAFMMNEKAANLGLNSSHFVTPHGLDQDEHYTSAFELAKVADYALKNETFAKIVRTSNYTVNINGYSKNLHNTNELLGYLDGVYGVKTGFTNGANRCLVTSCKRGDLDIICVVLGCDTKKDRSSDSVKLINYVFDNFTVVNINDIIQNDFNNWLDNQSKSISINKGIYSKLNFVLDSSQIPFDKIAVKNDSIKNIYTDIDFSTFFNAPLNKNTVIGSLIVNINGYDYFSVDILNDSLVKKRNMFFYIDYFIRNYFRFFES